MMRKLIEKKFDKWARKIRDEHGIPLSLRLPNGKELQLAGACNQQVVVTIHNKTVLPSLMNATLDKLADAYVQEKIDVKGELREIISVAHKLANASNASVQTRLQRVVKHLSHSRKSDRKAIEYHYDVSNDFYKLWLDRNMVYSCAYFANGDEDIETAQMAKIDHILKKIDLKPNQTLLDIGCGWGALVIRAAQKYGAQCLGITLSENQFAFANARIKQAGLADRVEIRLMDYRDLEGTFDRITSVGMFEHVGKRNLPTYFSKIQQLLKDEGVAMNHGITSTDADSGDTALGGGDFIDKYVFPEGELPHLSLVLDKMQRSGLEVFDVENLRRHYANTLGIWAERFEQNSESIRLLVDEKKYRIWRIYLAGCAHAFETDQISIYQIVCRKAGRSAASLPWSRRYMYVRTGIMTACANKNVLAEKASFNDGVAQR